MFFAYDYNVHISGHISSRLVSRICDYRNMFYACCLNQLNKKPVALSQRLNAKSLFISQRSVLAQNNGTKCGRGPAHHKRMIQLQSIKRNKTYSNITHSSCLICCLSIGTAEWCMEYCVRSIILKAFEFLCALDCGASTFANQKTLFCIM